MILGGTGFIGSILVNSLATTGVVVQCLVHHTKLKNQLTDNVHRLPGALLTFDWKNAADCDVIFHLARIPGKGAAGRRIAALHSACANRRLIAWMRAQQNPPFLVFVAGTLSYGSHHDKWIDEDTALKPTSFARQYAAGEKPIVDAILNGSIPGMVTRPAWVYGNRSWCNSFFLTPIQQRNAVPLYGNGNNWMSFVHVVDCANMIIHIALHGAFSETYNIFCGEPIRQKDFVQLLSECFNSIPIEQIGKNDLKKQFGKAIAEAFTFSLKARTKHTSLYRTFEYQYPNLKDGITSLISK